MTQSTRTRSTQTRSTSRSPDLTSSEDRSPPPSPGACAPRSADTRERILDAAERLFADDGIEATSLRTLTRAAGVNLAAVHYHFGSKDALLDAVIERRAGPVGAAQVAALRRVEQRPRVEVGDILRAFLLPVTEGTRSPDQRPILAQLLSRIQAQAPEVVEQRFRRHFGLPAREFTEALQRALPQLPPNVVADRFRFAVGAVIHVFSGAFALDTIPGHPAATAEGPSSRSDVYEALISFLCAGMVASAPAEAHRSDLESER